MSTSILILSPLQEDRTSKAVAHCLARAATLVLTAPTIEVHTIHPDPESLAVVVDQEEDDEYEEQLEDIASIISIQSEHTLSQDPVFVECLRFLMRRVGPALVQFPDGLADIELSMALIATLDGIESFDEREEARSVHVQLLKIKYRLLANNWKLGDEKWIPRALSNQEIEQFERNSRLEFPADFRAYLAIVGTGPGPSPVGLVPLDEMEKPKTHAKVAKRPRLGKTVIIGRFPQDHCHILVTDGDEEGTIWETVVGAPTQKVADTFIPYIERWIGEGDVELLTCGSCGLELQVQDLERGFCQACGTRKPDAKQTEASKAFEALSMGLLAKLIDSELLELEDMALLAPLTTALSDYMSEKGHKWKSPDRAAASIAGWLMHRDEVAELHGTNSDVAKIFVAVGSA